MPRLVAITAMGMLVLMGCTMLSGNRSDWEVSTGLDHRLSRFAYIEEGKLVGLAVDVQAARYREDTPFFPLEIAVANRSMHRLTIKRESFWLIDEEGNRYSLAGIREMAEGYSLVDLDKRFTDFRSVLLSRWPNFTKLPSNFYQGEGPSAGVVFDLVELPKFSYFTDWIYFPHPKTGVKGHRFELFLDTEELETPIFVKFKVD